MKIRTKITSALLAVSLGSILLLSAVSFHFAQKSLIEARGQELTAVVSGQRRSIENVLIAWQDRINLISSRTQLRFLFRELLESPREEYVLKIKRILDDAESSTRAIQGVAMCDMKGGIIVSSADGERSSACGEYTDVSRNETHLRKLWMGQDNKLRALVTGPIRLEGEIIGVIHAVLNAQEILDVIQNYDGLGATGETLLAERTPDGNARFLTPLRYDENHGLKRIVEADKRNIPITQALLSKETALMDSGIVDYRGKKVLAATAYIPDLDWGLAAKIDRDEAVEPVRDLFAAIFGSVLVLSLFVAFFGLYLGRSITAPILKLVDLSQKVKDGDWSQKADIRSKDEMRDLGQALNAMLEGLHKRDAELVKAREKAEELNRLKSEFLATMSHEIRTPMNGILGMAELVLGARPSGQIEGYARTIINSGESLLQIIDDILDFSKIEAGKLEIDPMPVDMLEIADEVATLYAVRARDKALELAVRYVPGSEQFVFADPVRVRQILGNLVSNAIKFTDKGHVAVTIGEEKNADLPEDKVLLTFSVSDTGIGLSEEAQARIFEKFNQADTSTTRKYGGTGLGLSICKSLVGLMSGELTVESAEGAGSTFKFSIPFTRNDRESQVQPKPPVLKDIRVLIVDDLPLIRQLVSEQLTAAGMRCDTAESGEIALSMMQQAHTDMDPYQMAVIDYLMPEINGEMLASMINDYPHLRETCLVMLTAAGNPLADDLFAEKGFSAYIAKPVEHKALIRSLAIVWAKYQEGYKDVLIRVDTSALGRDHDGEDEPSVPGAKILVAEDNLVNQVFIKEILEEMEADYTVVSNGLEAVEAVKENDFVLVIMDCLMPEMDGFEATQEICALKRQGTVKEALPIVALTANAMKGDREKCLEAGMDDYLSKPVRKKELKNAVYRLITGRNYAAVVEEDENIFPTMDNTAQAEKPSAEIIPLAQPGQQEDLSGVLDTEAVESARGILKGKYEEMVNIYIDNCWERIEEIMQAVGDDDAEGVVRPAHTLKSTSKQMGALKLSDMAKAVELTAKALVAGETEDGQDMDSIAQSMEEIKAVLSETKRAFDRMAA